MLTQMEVVLIVEILQEHIRQCEINYAPVEAKEARNLIDRLVEENIGEC